ncbi:hypothetical protein CVT26_004299 [Gymnopilus dilepis]|uniref:Uncharacterized protein n=1 Tax=Gymnopilus dilepis TaxID=231916 RepID=A0A409WYI9_9AGAR|nr:hypothetical protein CVT26_004299 [Gymnopilus dilepis]
MKSFTFATAILFAAIASVVKADNCTPGLVYCGHSLISKGNYRAQLDQVYQDVKGITVTSTDGDVWNGDLFSCDGGRSGTVTWLQSCANGVCDDNGNGKSDTCA